MAIIEITSIVAGILLGVWMAVSGYGYWTLVGMAIVVPATYCLGLWLATGWMPGLPRRGSGVLSMLWFGGTVTINVVVVYIAYNLDKVLIGRFCGAQILGLYGRAYQLINLPTENLNSAVSSVAFPALSRVQGDPVRLRSYFLRGYSLFLSLVVPITLGCALFAHDIVQVFLGPKWLDAAVPFQLLSPTVLAFALINPFGWLLFATGRARRSLFIAFLIAPVVVAGYLIGLRHGGNGVAAGFSLAMLALVVPVVLWSKHGTLITNYDWLQALWPVAASAMVGVAAAVPVHQALAHFQPALLRLVVESASLFGPYFLALLFVMNQKPIYIRLMRETGLWPAGNRAHL
jgi:O-antigen/teichoic acid export membrane protein